MCHNLQTPLTDFQLRSAGVESATKNHRMGVLGNVDKATWPHRITGQLRDIDIASSVDLTKPKKSDIQPTTRIEIEL